MTFFIVAFLGGLLSLVPACGPALLPGFFAFAMRQKNQFFRGFFAFFLGFSCFFIPLGVGVSVVINFLVYSRAAAFDIAGLILVFFGVVTLLDLHLPIYFTAATSGKGFLFRNFFIGMAFGLTSSACITPIYGSIISLGSVAGNTARTFLLLLTFELGMFFPLLVLSVFGQSYSFASMNRQFSLLGYKISLYNLLTGCLLVFLGIDFIFFKGGLYGSLFNRLNLSDWFEKANNHLLYMSK